MRQCKRRQGAGGHAQIRVYVAHWLNYGVLLPLHDDADPAFVDRALDFAEFLERRWRESKGAFAGLDRRTELDRNGHARAALRPRIEVWLRGERWPVRQSDLTEFRECR